MTPKGVGRDPNPIPGWVTTPTESQTWPGVRNRQVTPNLSIRGVPKGGGRDPNQIYVPKANQEPLDRRQLANEETHRNRVKKKEQSACAIQGKNDARRVTNDWIFPLLCLVPHGRRFANHGR